MQIDLKSSLAYPGQDSNNKSPAGSAIEKLLAHVGPLRAAVDMLLEVPGPPEKVAALCLSRFDPPNRHRLINIPFTLGATALILRARAHWPSQMETLEKNIRLWRELGLAALDAAPDLFARDLCLTELAIVQEEDLPPVSSV